MSIVSQANVTIVPNCSVDYKTQRLTCKLRCWFIRWLSPSIYLHVSNLFFLAPAPLSLLPSRLKGWPTTERSIGKRPLTGKWTTLHERNCTRLSRRTCCHKSMQNLRLRWQKKLVIK